NDGNVYALNASSGTKIWNYSTGSSIRAATGIARGVLYVGAANGKVYAIGTPQQIISPTPSPTPNGATPTPIQTTSPTTSAKPNPTSNPTPTESPQQTPEQTRTPTPTQPPPTTHPTANTGAHQPLFASTPLLITSGILGLIALAVVILAIRYNGKRLYDLKRKKSVNC
ncbi:MAG: PQQ-binding-like beta-propeller repeat protein, partial [Bacillota bacterium]